MVGNLSTVHVDPSGDLKLVVGFEDGGAKTLEPRIFVVSSKSLCLASPVWKATFDPQGPWASQVQDKDGFRMIEDDPDALSILLDAAHLNFDRVPMKTSFEELFNLAILCDKYDAVKLVRPWVSGWVDHLQPSWPVTAPGSEDWLFISWTFGFKTIYNDVWNFLVSEGYRSRDGGYANQSGQILVEENMPPGALESIVQAREKTIDGLLQLCRKLVDLYVQSPRICTGYEFTVGFQTTGPAYAKECDALVLGSLMKGLGSIGLWPIPESLNISVKALAQQLKNLTCHLKPVQSNTQQLNTLSRIFDLSSTNIPDRPMSPAIDLSSFTASQRSTLDRIGLENFSSPSNQSLTGIQDNIQPSNPNQTKNGQGELGAAHLKCDFTIKLRKDVQRILDEMPSGILDSHREHLVEQEKKRSAFLPRNR